LRGAKHVEGRKSRREPSEKNLKKNCAYFKTFIFPRESDTFKESNDSTHLVQKLEEKKDPVGRPRLVAGGDFALEGGGHPVI